MATSFSADSEDEDRGPRQRRIIRRVVDDDDNSDGEAEFQTSPPPRPPNSARRSPREHTLRRVRRAARASAAARSDGRDRPRSRSRRRRDAPAAEDTRGRDARPSKLKSVTFSADGNESIPFSALAFGKESFSQVEFGDLVNIAAKWYLAGLNDADVEQRSAAAGFI